jgi:membrane protease YdiL (CAAX protease family)
VFPYILSIQGDLLKQTGQPIWLIFIAQLVQSVILFAIVIFLGLFFTKKIGFRLPLLEAVLEKRKYKIILKNILAPSVLSGILIAIIIYILDSFFTLLGTTITTHQNSAPIWQKLLASFYGGITEEILMRLFVMTLFIWIGMKLFRQKTPSKIGIIIPIFISAIIFGLGHLPITASLTQITPIVVVRAVILNSIGGLVFGWLFWKRGLESAMVAHFTTDIFLLTLLPLFLK